MEQMEIRFSGTGGQGLLLCGRLLAEALIGEGRTVAQSQSYEPTSRGGVSRSDLVVADAQVDYPLVTALDYLVVLEQSAVAVSNGLIKKGSIVIIDAARVTKPPEGDFLLHALDLSDTARALGNERVTNVVALGAFSALSTACRPDSLEQSVRTGTPKRFMDLNLEALGEGARMALAAAG
jgi:2-oxoglutarate ferredoxin oxidoreductase subunit gamma